MPGMKNSKKQCDGISKHGRITFALLVAALLVGVPSCDEREPASPRERLEESLRRGVRLHGYPWPAHSIHMAGLEEAMEKARSLPMTPRQAWDKVLAYSSSLPEDEQLSEQCKTNPLACYVWEDYYFFNAFRLRLKVRQNLRGYFVDTRTGDVIRYPGGGLPGVHRRTNSYWQILPYRAEEGAVLFDPDDPEALYYLGSCYAVGCGVTKSAEKAVACWMRSAEQGYPGAQRQLGLCYSQGLGVGKSDELARQWLFRAAEQGDSEATEALRELDGPRSAPVLIP